MVARKRTATQVEPEYLKVADVAAYLSCHRNTINRWVKRGLLVKVRVGTVERIPMASIRALTQEPPATVRVARPRRKGGKAVRVA
jgi:excisionase family DNA binding protein